MFPALVLVSASACVRDNPAFDGGADERGGETRGETSADTGETSGGESGESGGESGETDTSESSSEGESDTEPSCQAPLSPCGDLCVDTNIDVDNCGSCGSVCDGSCSQGNCIVDLDKRVFALSVPVNGAMGGLAGADEKCTAAAAEASLDGAFMAWLSTANAGPAQRMTHHDGPYVLIGGQTVALNWADLTDGSLAHAIDRDEYGDPPALGDQICEGKEVWTNTKPDGTPATAEDCAGWTASAEYVSQAGRWPAADVNWSLACPSVVCSSELLLYCFEQ